MNERKRKSWGLWKHDWEKALVLVRKEKVNNRLWLPAASTKWSRELHSPCQRGRPLMGGGWGPRGPSAAQDLCLMRNSWGFRGVQRSSFSHCNHGPPVVGWWGFSFSPEMSPEEESVPYSTRAGARLPAGLCIWDVGCRITTCHLLHAAKNVNKSFRAAPALAEWVFSREQRPIPAN